MRSHPAAALNTLTAYKAASYMKPKGIVFVSAGTIVRAFCPGDGQPDNKQTSGKDSE